MTCENKKKYSMLVPAEMAFSSTVRKTTESILNYLHIDDKEVFRLVLVIDELFMNAVQHGSSPEKNSESAIHITFLFEKGKDLQVIMEDEGTGTNNSPENIKKKMSLEFQQNNLEKSSGRGLAQIALNLTSHFNVENSQYGGIKISFIKHLDTITQ